MVKLRGPIERRARRRVFSYSGGESKTDQSQAEGCDINVMVASYMKAGAIPLPDKEALFSDVFALSSFHESMDTVVAGREMFASFPSAIRDRFGNKPEAFLLFAENPKNAEAVADMFGFKKVLKPLKDSEAVPKGKESETPPKAPVEPVKPISKASNAAPPV